jgi:hypothetical protein
MHKSGSTVWRSRLMHRVTSRELLGFEGCKRLHQAALAAGGVVLVDDALFSSLVQAADGLEHGGLIGSASFDGGASFAHGGAGTTTEFAVAQAAGFILVIAFDLRLNVSQGTSSEKNYPFTAGLNSTRWVLFCPVRIKVLA